MHYVIVDNRRKHRSFFMRWEFSDDDEDQWADWTDCEKHAMQFDSPSEAEEFLCAAIRESLENADGSIIDARVEPVAL